MPEEHDQFSSGFNVVLDVLRAIVDAVKEEGGSDDDLTWLLFDEDLKSSVGKLIAGYRKTFAITVDYDISLQEMIKAGRYDADDCSRIKSAGFDINGEDKQEVVVQLIQFRKPGTTANVLRQVKHLGYRMAKPEEFLALGAQYPNLQKRFTIVTIDTRPGNEKCVLGIYPVGTKRVLGMEFLESECRSGFYFLVVNNT